MASATQVNRSGSMAKGPRPTARNPKSHCTKGLVVRAYRSRTIENITSPTVNSDLVFMYMSLYVINRKIRRVALTVETTVLIV